MIQLKNVSKVYHNSHENNAVGLRGVDLKLGDNGLVFIVGPSGSGKSTLLNILSGLDAPTAGSMELDGVSLGTLGSVGLDEYRTSYVGVVYQNNNLLDHLTLGQNAALAVEIMGREVTEDEIRMVFERLGIGHLVNRFPHEVSGGQAQRAAIARVLIKKPQILFTDELTSNLDEDQRDEVYKLLKELSAEVLVIATTHQREMIDRFADRVITMESGAIASDKFIDRKMELEVGSEKPMGEFKFERTRLPFKKALKMGWTHFKMNRFRTSFMIVLSVLAIAMFTMTTTLGMVRENRAIINSFSSSNQPYISFRNNARSISIADRNAWWAYGESPMQRLHDSAIVHEISPSVMSEVAGEQIFGIRYIATVTQNLFDMELVAGRWPQSGDTTNQVVISDFVATQIATALGEDIEDLVGESVELGELRFTVIGIYQTNFAEYFNTFDFTLRHDLTIHEIRAAVYLMQNNWVTAFALHDVVDRIGLGQSHNQIHQNGIVPANGFFIADHAASSSASILNGATIEVASGVTPVLPGTARISQDLADALNISLDYTVIEFYVNRTVADLGLYYRHLHNDALPINNSSTVYNIARFNIMVHIDTGLPGMTMHLSGGTGGDYARLVSALVVPGVAFIVANYGADQLMGVLNRMPEGSFATFKDSASISEFTQNFADMQGVLIGVAAIIGMLGLFLMFSYIILSVRSKRKTIAILRSLGAKTIDIMVMFLTEAILLATFIISGALIVSVVGMVIGNAVVQSSTQNTLMIFSTPWWLYMSILGGVFLTILVTYLVPVWRQSRYRKDKGVLEVLRQKLEN